MEGGGWRENEIGVEVICQSESLCKIGKQYCRETGESRKLISSCGLVNARSERNMCGQDTFYSIVLRLKERLGSLCQYLRVDFMLW